MFDRKQLFDEIKHAVLTNDEKALNESMRKEGARELIDRNDDETGFTVLEMAACLNYSEMVELLIDRYQANVDCNNRRVVRVAIDYNSHGVPDRKSDGTAIRLNLPPGVHKLAEPYYISTIRILLERGGNPNKLALQQALWYSQHEDIIFYLVGAEADLNSDKDPTGKTAHNIANAQGRLHLFTAKYGNVRKLWLEANNAKQKALQQAKEWQEYTAKKKLVGVQAEKPPVFVGMKKVSSPILPKSLLNNASKPHAEVEIALTVCGTALKVDEAVSNVVSKVIDNELRALSNARLPKPTAAELHFKVIQRVISHEEIIHLPPKSLVKFSHAADNLVSKQIDHAKQLVALATDQAVSGVVDQWVRRTEEIRDVVKLVGQGDLRQIREKLNGLVDELPVGGFKAFNKKEGQQIVKNFFGLIKKKHDELNIEIKAVNDLKNVLADLPAGDVLQKKLLAIDLEDAKSQLLKSQLTVSTDLKDLGDVGKLAGSLIGLSGNSELGDQIVAVTEAGIQVVDAIGNLVSGAASGVMVGGPVGAVVGLGSALINLFGAASKPDVGDVVKKEIANLSKHMDQRFDVVEGMLETIHTQMHGRFDRLEDMIGVLGQQMEFGFAQMREGFEQMHGRFDQLDRMLIAIHERSEEQFAHFNKRLGFLEQHIDELHALVIVRFFETHGQVKHVEKTLKEIQEQMSGIHEKLDLILNEIRQQSYTDAKKNAGKLNQFDQARIQVAVQCAVDFVDWATQGNIKTAAIVGEVKVSGTDTFCNQMQGDYALFEKVNSIISYARTNLHSEYQGKRVVSPVQWAEACNEYMQLFVNNPDLGRSHLEANAEAMIEAGESFNQFIHQIKTDAKLFQLLLSGYKNAARDFLYHAYTINLGDPSKVSAASFDSLQGELMPLFTPPAAKVVAQGTQALLPGAVKLETQAVAKSAYKQGWLDFIGQNLDLLTQGKKKEEVLVILKKGALASFAEAKANDVLPNWLPFMEGYFFLADPNALNKELRNALFNKAPQNPEEKHIVDRSEELLKKLNTAYQLLSIYVRVAFSEECEQDLALHTYLFSSLWNGADIQHYLDGKQSRPAFTLAMQQQLMPSIDEFESYLLDKCLAAKRTPKAEQGLTVVRGMIEELKRFEELYKPQPAPAPTASWWSSPVSVYNLVTQGVRSMRSNQQHPSSPPTVGLGGSSSSR